VKDITADLDALAAMHRKFLLKGGLSVGLIVTKIASQRGLPIEAAKLRTAEGGQVAGLGKGAVQKLLAEFGITEILAKEGGRTSRGSLGLMEKYVALLNELSTTGPIDFESAMQWWISKVKLFFATKGPKFAFDSGKSILMNLDDLFKQALAIQKNSGGTSYLGAMLQHLIGAKLDLILGAGAIQHHGFSVADDPTDRSADFQVSGVAIHVTTRPTEALIQKAAENLKRSLRPLIITLWDGVAGAQFLLKNTEWASRVDVLDAAQFLTANVYERSLLKTGECSLTMLAIIERYNEVVASCEVDPVLVIQVH
jgi:hypothetical protein